MGYRANQGGPPGWFVFLIGIAFVFGIYYLYTGALTFFETGGRSVLGAADQAQLNLTATMERRLDMSLELPTRRPTSTPVPDCQVFVVVVPSAIVRALPSTGAPIVQTHREGEEICVIEREAGTDWYLIDSIPATRRIDAAYMRDDLIRPRFPTPTPSNTLPPPPTITSTPTPTVTPTPTITLTPEASATPDANATPTPTVTPSPTLTPPVIRG